MPGRSAAWRDARDVRHGAVRLVQPTRSVRRATFNPFAAVTTELRAWFEAEPWHTSRELLERLQAERPGAYPFGDAVDRVARGDPGERSRGGGNRPGTICRRRDYRTRQ
jgi:hypothetical protein